MEKRLGKIIVGSAGGNASKGSKGYKISLPSQWVNQLELTKQRVELTFDGEKITLTPILSIEKFIELKKAQGDKLIIFRFFDKDKLCTEICADFTDKTLSFRNKTQSLVKTAFGKKQVPTWDDFEEFLEERCIPRDRSGIREYLEAIGIDEYDPIEIIKKTAGKMAEDQQHIEIEEIQ